MPEQRHMIYQATLHHVSLLQFDWGVPNFILKKRLIKNKYLSVLLVFSIFSIMMIKALAYTPLSSFFLGDYGFYLKNHKSENNYINNLELE